ncbi:BCL-6 corepressor, partial [Trichinella sp. T9]
LLHYAVIICYIFVVFDNGCFSLLLLLLFDWNSIQHCLNMEQDLEDKNEYASGSDSPNVVHLSQDSTYSYDALHPAVISKCSSNKEGLSNGMLKFMLSMTTRPSIISSCQQIEENGACVRQDGIPAVSIYTHYDNLLKNVKHSSGLHYACLNGLRPMVEDLLSRGADANELAIDGTTPLFVAAKNNHLEIVELLLKHHADPALCTTGGKRPIDVASMAAVHTLLEDAGRTVNSVHNDQEDACSLGMNDDESSHVHQNDESTSNRTRAARGRTAGRGRGRRGRPPSCARAVQTVSASERPMCRRGAARPPAGYRGRRVGRGAGTSGAGDVYEFHDSDTENESRPAPAEAVENPTVGKTRARKASARSRCRRGAQSRKASSRASGLNDDPTPVSRASSSKAYRAVQSDEQLASSSDNKVPPLKLMLNKKSSSRRQQRNPKTKKPKKSYLLSFKSDQVYHLEEFKHLQVEYVPRQPKETFTASDLWDIDDHSGDSHYYWLYNCRRKEWAKSIMQMRAVGYPEIPGIAHFKTLKWPRPGCKVYKKRLRPLPVGLNVAWCAFFGSQERQRWDFRKKIHDEMWRLRWNCEREIVAIMNRNHFAKHSVQPVTAVRWLYEGHVVNLIRSLRQKNYTTPVPLSFNPMSVKQTFKRFEKEKKSRLHRLQHESDMLAQKQYYELKVFIARQVSDRRAARRKRKVLLSKYSKIICTVKVKDKYKLLPEEFLSHLDEVERMLLTTS